MVKVRKRLIDFYANGNGVISKEKYQELIMQDGNKPTSPFKEKTLDI